MIIVVVKNIDGGRLAYLCNTAPTPVYGRFDVHYESIIVSRRNPKPLGKEGVHHYSNGEWTKISIYPYEG